MTSPRKFLKSTDWRAALWVMFGVMFWSCLAQAQDTFDDQVTIGDRAFDDQVTIGDRAFVGGLFAKAAEAYVKAWELKPREEAIGMKAAMIYVEKLDDKVSAAPIVFGLQAKGRKPEFADALKALAERIGPAVKAAYRAKLISGKTAFAAGQYDDAANDFMAAAKMQPRTLAARVQVARVRAKRGDGDGVKTALGGILGYQVVKVEQIFSAEAPELIDLLEDAAFAEYITAVMGEGTVAKAKANKPRPPKSNPTDGAELVWVPGGEFDRGSDKDGNPTHTVAVDGFYIYRNEVTVDQYQRFCFATGRPMPEDKPDWGWGANEPIVNISWDDAVAYCKWAGVRLPTEAEWEKAARGTDGRLYPWGDDWSPTKLRFHSGNPATIGSYPQDVSPYGALDMAGNVSEWCADWDGKDYYATATASNPKGPDLGQLRVVRGSCYGHFDPAAVRLSHRYALAPDRHESSIGFRCAEGP